MSSPMMNRMLGFCCPTAWVIGSSRAGSAARAIRTVRFPRFIRFLLVALSFQREDLPGALGHQNVRFGRRHGGARGRRELRVLTSQATDIYAALGRVSGIR